MKSFRLSRRACLKGLGVSVALPWLEIMEPTKKAFAQPSAPLRYLAIYSPNGFLTDKLIPAGTGTTWTTPPLLKPLEAYRSDFSVLSGMGNFPASISGQFNGSHTRGCATLLTSSPITFTSGNDVKNNISVDQVIANHLKTTTRFPSIQVGAANLSGRCEDGFSCAYQNNISWSGPTTFLPKQVNPRDAFNRLFMDGGGLPPPMMMGMTGTPTKPDNRKMIQKSILDLVRGRADALRGRLGKGDRVKLDEYLTSVREVEGRVDAAIKAGLSGGGGGGPSGPPPAACGSATAPMSTTGMDIPFPMHLDALSDVIALAFQCDLTRVATYMFEQGFTDVRNFSFLGVTARHHALTHSSGAAALANEEKINLFYLERFAYLLGKLKAIKEGDRTVLDNSIVMLSSEFGNGHVHDFRKMVVLLAGKAGGKWKSGLHVSYPLDAARGTGADGTGNPKDTQVAQLHLTALQAFGINQQSWGFDAGGMPLATKTLTDFVA
ncbi:MAG TPA: DUF1552 domain-containing protein [Polyangia bacterium]